jgi:hypothetical protein
MASNAWKQNIYEPSGRQLLFSLTDPGSARILASSKKSLMLTVELLALSTTVGLPMPIENGLVWERNTVFRLDSDFTRIWITI